MRFLDYNGTGGLDPQDIATSVAVEEAQRDDAVEEAGDEDSQPLEANAGCASTAALVALPFLIILLAL